MEVLVGISPAVVPIHAGDMDLGGRIIVEDELEAGLPEVPDEAHLFQGEEDVAELLVFVEVMRPFGLETQ